jgi:hypothetical protein
MSKVDLEHEVKPRRLMIVIEDDGADKFAFRLEGDIERLSMPQIPPSLYSAAEFWALEFFKLCHERLRQGGDVKALNRAERRAQP